MIVLLGLRMFFDSVAPFAGGFRRYNCKVQFQRVLISHDDFIDVIVQNETVG